MNTYLTSGDLATISSFVSMLNGFTNNDLTFSVTVYDNNGDECGVIDQSPDTSYDYVWAPNKDAL